MSTSDYLTPEEARTRLQTIRLPIREIDCAMPLYRCFGLTHDPIYFGPGAGKPPDYRFDSASGSYGCLYAADNREAPIVETLMRNTVRRGVPKSKVTSRGLVTLQLQRTLRLVDTTGANLSRLGMTAAFLTLEYAESQAWSEAFWNHPDAPDGLIYHSRHNPALECMAIFEREDHGISEASRIELKDDLAFVSNLLDAHGKSLL